MSEKQKFAVFDIDGTIYRYVLHHAVLDAMEDEGLIDTAYVEKIKTKRLAWKNREHPESFWDFVEAQNTYWFEKLTEISPAKFKQLSKDIVDRTKSHVYVYTSELLKKCKAEGRFVIAISGSAEDVILPFTDHWEFDLTVAASYEIVDGKFTGNRVATFKDKHLILESIVKEHNLSWKDSIAVGDTENDISLLEAVENPIAFNPNKTFVDAAMARGWTIVVERKNVAYRMTCLDGKYLMELVV